MNMIQKAKKNAFFPQFHLDLICPPPQEQEGKYRTLDFTTNFHYFGKFQHFHNFFNITLRFEKQQEN